MGAAEYSGIVGIEEEGCQRRCHPDWAHRNIIIYDNSQRGAGLKDRLAILSFLALLAGHLCAVVYLPPPYNLRLELDLTTFDAAEVRRCPLLPPEFDNLGLLKSVHVHGYTLVV